MRGGASCGGNIDGTPWEESSIMLSGGLPLAFFVPVSDRAGGIAE